MFQCPLYLTCIITRSGFNRELCLCAFSLAFIEQSQTGCRVEFHSSYLCFTSSNSVVDNSFTFSISHRNSFSDLSSHDMNRPPIRPSITPAERPRELTSIKMKLTKSRGLHH